MSTLRRSIRQAWWAPLAALVAAYQVVVAVIVPFEKEDLDSKVASVTILLLGAAIMSAGLALRPEHRARGNGLILVGCFFAVFWFWTLVLPIAGAVIAIGVLASGWRERVTAST